MLEPPGVTAAPGSRAKLMKKLNVASNGWSLLAGVTYGEFTIGDALENDRANLLEFVVLNGRRYVLLVVLVWR